MEEVVAPSVAANTSSPNNSQSSAAAAVSSWWGWGSTLLEKTVDTVKQQSESLIHIYKEEIQEFTKTIQEDTKEVLKKLPKETTQTTEKITLGITDLLGLNAHKGPEDKRAKSSVFVDRQKARLLALQSELSTYCTDPTDVEEFVNWRAQFALTTRTEEISTLLSNNEKIREIHTKLVSYKDFWERYYYKLHKLNQEEERRAALVKRATATGMDEEEVGWDLEDDTEEKPEEKKETEETPKQEVEQYLEKLDDKAEIKEETKQPSPKKEETKPTSTEKKPAKEKTDDMEDDWESWE